jgi:hypothetical protein
MLSDGSMALTATGAQRAIRTGGKDAVAAADIEPSQALADRQPIQKCFTDETAPTTYAPFIGFAVREKLFILAHAKHQLSRKQK